MRRFSRTEFAVRLWRLLSVNRWLLNYLVIPMTVLSAAALGVAWLTSGLWQELAINLCFLFLGALITVIYVDWAVNKHEQSRWAPFQGAADNHVRRVTAAFLYQVGEIFDTDTPSRFQIPAWKSKNETRLWHLELVRDDEWYAFIRKIATGRARRVGFDVLHGDHKPLISYLESFSAELERTLLMYGRILTPIQLATAARLIEEIPSETWLLHATQHEGANFVSANLEGIMLGALDLIKDVNSRNDPRSIDLPWREAVADSSDVTMHADLS